MRKIKTCGECLFYRLSDDEIGTCTISDNIAENGQEACNNYQGCEIEEKEIKQNTSWKICLFLPYAMRK